MLENYELSIITPHYNSPQLLRKLLDSIPENSEIEIIVVDDRSDKYIEEYEKIRKEESSRAKFLKNNAGKKGAGTCRNIGLASAKGKWILFADADDYFLPGFYKKVSKHFESDYDVIFFTPTSIYLENNQPSTRHLGYKRLIEDYLNNAKDSELKLRYYFRSPCSKMVRLDFIKDHKIYCDEVIVCNDDMFSVKLGHYMENFAVTREEIYCITDHVNSLSRKKGKEYFWSCFDVNLRIDRFLRENLLKKDYKKLRLFGINVLRQAVDRYDLNFIDLIQIIKILTKNKIPFLPLSYLSPLKIFRKVFEKSY